MAFEKDLSTDPRIVKFKAFRSVRDVVRAARPFRKSGFSVHPGAYHTVVLKQLRRRAGRVSCAAQ